MKELTSEQLQQVEGGIILPLVLGVVAADIALMAAMYGASYWQAR